MFSIHSVLIYNCWLRSVLCPSIHFYSLAEFHCFPSLTLSPLTGDCNCAVDKIHTKLFLYPQHPLIKCYWFFNHPLTSCMRLTHGWETAQHEHISTTVFSYGKYLFCLTCPDLSEDHSLLAGSKEWFPPETGWIWPVKGQSNTCLKGGFSGWPVTLPK